MLFTYKTKDGFSVINTDNIVYAGLKDKYLYILTNVEYSAKIPVTKPNSNVVIPGQFTRSKEMFEIYIEDENSIKKFFNFTKGNYNIEDDMENYFHPPISSSQDMKVD